MRKLIIWTGLIIPSFILLVSFQNCSKIQTEDLLANQVGKLNSPAVDTADLPTGTTVALDQDGKRTTPVSVPPAIEITNAVVDTPTVKDSSSTQQPPTVDTPVVTDQPVAVSPPAVVAPPTATNPPAVPVPPTVTSPPAAGSPIVTDPSGGVNPPICVDQDDKGNSVIAQCQNQPELPSTPPVVVKPPVGSVDDQDDQELENARLHCKIAREQGSVKRIISKILRIQEVKEDTSFQRLNGRYIFLGGSSHSKILNIHSSNGLKIFCDLEIDRIEDSDGRIILINSHIKELVKHNGRMDLIDNSRVEKIEKSSCNIKKHEK